MPVATNGEIGPARGQRLHAAVQPLKTESPGSQMDVSS